MMYVMPAARSVSRSRATVIPPTNTPGATSEQSVEKCLSFACLRIRSSNSDVVAQSNPCAVSLASCCAAHAAHAAPAAPAASGTATAGAVSPSAMPTPAVMLSLAGAAALGPSTGTAVARAAAGNDGAADAAGASAVDTAMDADAVPSSIVARSTILREPTTGLPMRLRAGSGTLAAVGLASSAASGRVVVVKDNGCSPVAGPELELADCIAGSFPVRWVLCAVGADMARRSRVCGLPAPSGVRRRRCCRAPANPVPSVRARHPTRMVNPQKDGAALRHAPHSSVHDAHPLHLSLTDPAPGYVCGMALVTRLLVVQYRRPKCSFTRSAHVHRATLEGAHGTVRSHAEPEAPPCHGLLGTSRTQVRRRLRCHFCMRTAVTVPTCLTYVAGGLLRSQLETLPAMGPALRCAQCARGALVQPCFTPAWRCNTARRRGVQLVSRKTMTMQEMQRHRF